ncbi:2'-5' RNA ligase family protein [Roseicella sp. DB1501]|uniref:2'-5' RNA ligase family protein n=1 Tax=Roseicella sp. DB1501 TaxID=2730925 RepID=UPI0014931EBA|nr:2'-5' RNA ligase family protein [Roseicella sp. DB1501]NOG69243.1 2'-5' RNA ligase family protein [Roseicella sp. DB1501]
MAGEEAAPLVLTLGLDAATQAWLEALRQRHFPPDRNRVPAHVTLFHALPGGAAAEIWATLADEAAALPPAPVTVGPPRLLGRGVALAIASPTIAALRARLGAAWQGWLTAQDRQPWRPHATVQNKVAPEAARALHRQLTVETAVRSARAAALLLWHYRGPRAGGESDWEAAARLPFGAKERGH